MGRKIILKESELISLIEKVVKEQSRLSEDKNWIQKADKEFEKDGTAGEFGDWCEDQNKNWDGCTKACIDKGLKGTEKRRKQAQFAKNACK